MAEQLEQSEPVPVEEALQMEMIINQALIDILIAKDIFSEDELIDKIKELREEQGI
ncbi:MAG: hypothetical protein ABFS18_14680 [Thermodesulfobacteriota bacterium]